MSLYYRCHCSEVLEAPDGTEGEKALCPTCGKVVVIPKDPVQVTNAEKDEAQAAAASAPIQAPSLPGGVPVLPGREEPPVEAPEPVPISPDIAEPLPIEPGAVLPPPEPVPLGIEPPDIAPGPEPLGVGAFPAPAEGDSFEDILGMGAEAGAPVELLPEIPEIPVSGTAAAPPPEPAMAAAPAAPRARKGAPPAEKAVGADAVKAASKRAPIKAGPKASKRASQRGRSRRREPVVTCPECGAQVSKLAPVCEECGHRFKKGGILKSFLVLILLLVLAAGGLAVAVAFVPEKLPPIALEWAANIGDKLRDLGLPIPEDFGRLKQEGATGTEVEPASGDAEEAEAGAEEEALPVVGEDELDMDITVPGETPAPAEGLEEDITVE